jgi:glycopeptide antibiotics resistance protein
MRSAGVRASVESGQRQPGRPSGWLRLAALVYLAALVVATLLPIAPVRRPSNYGPQLVPFKGIVGELKHSPVERLAELFGNMLLFAPLGFLLPLLAPAIRRWWQALAAGAGISLLIELYQLVWPGVRKASVGDLLMNALGALLGFAVLRLTGHRRGGSSRRAPRCRYTRPP